MLYCASASSLNCHRVCDVRTVRTTKLTTANNNLSAVVTAVLWCCSAVALSCRFLNFYCKKLIPVLLLFNNKKFQCCSSGVFTKMTNGASHLIVCMCIYVIFYTYNVVLYSALLMRSCDLNILVG